MLGAGAHVWIGEGVGAIPHATQLNASIKNSWQLWFPTTGLTGLGFMGRYPTKNLRAKGVVYLKSLKQVYLEGNLGYFASYKRILLQLEETSQFILDHPPI